MIQKYIYYCCLLLAEEKQKNTEKQKKLQIFYHSFGEVEPAITD